MSIQPPATEDSAKTRARALGWAVAALVAGFVVGYGISEPGSVALEEIREHTTQILAERDTLQRGHDLATLFATASPEALDAIRDAYASAPPPANDLELILLAEWWAKFDPKAAYDWIKQFTGDQRFTASRSVFRVWARNAPGDALDAAQKLSDLDEQRIGIDAALIGWDESPHRDLAEYVYELPLGPDRQHAGRILARRRVATVGAKAAMAWAKQLPETKQFRRLMMPRVSSAIAESQPEFAARMVEDQIDATSRSGLPRRVATRWVRQDPEAAMAWLATLPAGVDRDDGVMESFRDWAGLDRDAAFSWLAARIREPVPWLDPAMYIYAMHLIARDPRRAVAVADLITNETQRNTAHTLILRGWLVRDPEAAEAWVRQADLPPGVVQRGRLTRGTRRPSARSPGQGPSVSSVRNPKADREGER